MDRISRVEGRRASRDVVLMEMALAVAQRGTCPRLQVGVVFSRDGRVISTGYNGAPAGLPHCHHTAWDGRGIRPVWVPTSREFEENTSLNVGTELLYYDGRSYTVLPEAQMAPGCSYAEHAERNAIAFAARHGVALEGSEMHVTHMPCYDCARAVINAGVERVIYQTRYRDSSGVDLLARVGITIGQVLDGR